MSTEQEQPVSLGQRIRQMQERIQSEADAAIDQHLVNLRMTGNEIRELSALEVYDMTVRKSLNKIAASINAEVQTIERRLRALRQSNTEVAA